MKYRCKDRDIKSAYDVISVGNCNLQNLLRFESPVAYNYNNDGWRYDLYVFGDKAISTGYSPIGRKIEYDVVREYDKRAEAIIGDYSKNWETRESEVRALLEEFIENI